MTMTPAMRFYFKLGGILGFCLLAIDVALAFKFGWSSKDGLVLGPIYAMIAFGSGILLVIAAYYWLTDVKWLGGAVAAVWALSLCFNVWSQVGTHTAGRMSDVQAADAQKARFTQSEKVVTSNEGKIAALKAKGDTLADEQAELVKVNFKDGWAYTVAPSSPEELDSPIKAKIDDIALETTKGGCRDKCQMKKEELAHLEKLRAKAVAIRENATEMRKTEQELVDARATLKGTDPGHSGMENQSGLYARLANFCLSCKASAEQTEVANEATGIASAIILCLMAAILIFAEAWPSLMEIADMHSNAAGRQMPAPQNYARPESSVPTVPAAPRSSSKIEDMLAKVGGLAKEQSDRVFLLDDRAAIKAILAAAGHA